MTKRIFYNLAILLLLGATPVFAASSNNTISLTTYYPAPYGSYDQFRLVPRADLTGACQDGTMYVRSSDNSFQYCSGSVWGGLGYWAKGIPAADAYLSPLAGATVDKYYFGGNYSNSLTNKPYVGIGTSNPHRMMHLLDTDSRVRELLVLENRATSNSGTASNFPGTSISFRGANYYVPSSEFLEFANMSILYQSVNATTKYGYFRISLADGTGVNEKFKITPSGWTGIRDAWPDAVLEVAGNRPTTTTGSNSYPYFMVSAHPDNDGNVMIIKADGTVGINNAAPSSTYKLDIKGSVNIDQISPGNGGNLIVYGDVRMTTATFTSDRNLKEDIAPLDHALDKVMRLQGVSYKLKETNNQQMGVIAQDVEKVFPEIVNGPEGHKGVEYNALIAPLIEAVKELNVNNTELKLKLETQQLLIEQQNQKILELENKLEHR